LNLSEKAKHIALLCSRLDMPGGIERAVINTAELLASHGHRVSLLILDQTPESFFPIRKDITIIHRKLSFGITNEGNVFTRKIRLLSDVLQLRKILREWQPDLVISTEYPYTVAAVLAGIRKKTSLVSWEHHHHAWLTKNRFWNWLYEQAYPKLHAIVCLTNREAEWYSRYAPTYVIPNSSDNNSGRLSSLLQKRILSIGWLIPRKGIDLLLTAAATLLNEFPDWEWKLIGKGEMKNDVLAFIQKNKLDNRMILQEPEDPDLDQEYLHSSLLVLTSRSEALPMVLIEAQSYGIPCVSFDCPSGPSDIIIDSATGFLVEKENTEQLVERIRTLIKDESCRLKMGEAAADNAKRFTGTEIYKQWEKLIDQVKRRD
jgi:glycosyltransferase involved in cell wall biosynthesis